jgi:hypothetical protein
MSNVYIALLEYLYNFTIFLRTKTSALSNKNKIKIEALKSF